ncbi:MAG: DNA polymerase IV [Planctomycetota bacterium]|jgi:DNA polymerase-4
MDPAILHVDMDAFYASVEVRDDPALSGKPVIVGGRPDSRGVVSAASYEAREFGVRSAMPLVRAGRLCPHGVFLPLRMDRYVESSEGIFSIFHDYTPLVEGLSLDEAFLDVRGSTRLFGSGPEIGREIQRRIEEEVGLPCSVGVAPVKFVAKIASDLEKPQGFVVVREEELAGFLAELPIERLWGVGEVTAEQLKHFGITTVGQIRAAGEEFLVEHFGEIGSHLGRLSRGVDRRAVSPESGRKSVGHETTFPEDIGERELLLSVLLGEVEEVARRARKGAHRGRTIVLKVRYAPFETHTSRVTVSTPTDATEEIFSAARALFEKNVRVPPREVRLLGVTLTGLEVPAARQLTLFDEKARRRARRVDETVDEIVDRMGRRAIRRAGGVNIRRKAKEDRPGDR